MSNRALASGSLWELPTSEALIWSCKCWVLFKEMLNDPSAVRRSMDPLCEVNMKANMSDRRDTTNKKKGSQSFSGISDCYDMRKTCGSRKSVPSAAWRSYKKRRQQLLYVIGSSDCWQGQWWRECQKCAIDWSGAVCSHRAISCTMTTVVCWVKQAVTTATLRAFTSTFCWLHLSTCSFFISNFPVFNQLSEIWL